MLDLILNLSLLPLRHVNLVQSFHHFEVPHIEEKVSVGARKQAEDRHMNSMTSIWASR